MSKKLDTVSLVLGSGGARGHAHLGVIAAVEERGLEIRNIAGSSMGAVIGGIYAADELDTYSDWAMSLSQRDVMRLLDFSFTWTSIFKGERIFDVLRDLIGDRDIEDLDRGFVAVATAIDQQREVWINKGSLFTAIRASTAVPGVFAPVELNNRLLVDGGLVNPIPIAPTLNDATDLTIAVNLNAIMETRHDNPDDDAENGSDGDGESSPYGSAIGKFIDGLIGSDDGDDEDVPDATDLLTKSIDVMQGAIARLKLAAYSPDMTVDISRDSATFFEFHSAKRMRDLGYEQTVKVLDNYLEK